MHGFYPPFFLKAFLYGFLLPFFIFSGCTQTNHTLDDRRIEIELNRFQAVRFDPSYYYDTEYDVDDLCEQLTRGWKENGINTVYVKVYDPIYGAVYRTSHPLNVQTDYGRVNFLKTMLKACHRQELAVYAWIPAFLHRHAWEAHPEWRTKQPDGTDYKPTPETYLLCVRQPQLREWWLAFIDDLLQHYKDLDGVDIAEPIVCWKPDEACFCDVCKAAYGKDSPQIPDDMIRSEPLSSLLTETFRHIHQHNKSVSITTVATPRADGSILPPSEQRALSGFDLDAILDAPYTPDIVNVELIWQQMADVYADTVTFTPAWTKDATIEMLEQIADRAHLVVHTELTPLGTVDVTESQFIASLRSAIDAGAWGIDFYDSYQADQENTWPRIREVLDTISHKRVIVYYDPKGINDARQVDVLLRHFHTSTALVPVDDDFGIPQNLPDADFVFYVGESYRESLPASFVRMISQTTSTVCWINHNLKLLDEQTLANMGISFETFEENTGYRIDYKGTLFPKIDSVLNVIQIRDSSKCRIVATARSEQRERPYVIQSGRFWYFADLPTSFVTEGGRHIVFADLLHDILREDHKEKHLALVRIEDVNPESNPQSLRDIADLLGSKKIPFAVGFTPFYLNPATNSAVSLSDSPEMAKALRHAVSKGGIIVLHGCTHQYRGESAVDYEFWDGLSDGPIFQDSEDYVRERIIRALNECAMNWLYPLVWETPHYAASMLDYQVINRYFTTAYERRQTIDVSGSDQLFPFYIPARDGRAQFIPENLGYIPMDNPDPDPVIGYARNNLAIRDGFASFFFHPFVPISVLKVLVEQIQDLGYTFADIRTLDNRVNTPAQAVVSGHQEIELLPKNQYVDEFLLTPRGKRKNHTTSKERYSEPIPKSIECPPGWMYVSLASDRKKNGFPANLWSSFSQSPEKVKQLWEQPPLVAANPPMIPLILIDPQAEGALFRDQASFLGAFDAVGIDYQILSVLDFITIPEKTNLLIIPYAAAKILSEPQILFITKALAEGMNLVLEKESELSTSIGISHLGEEKSIHTVSDEYYNQVAIEWKEADTYRQFQLLVEPDYETFYSETHSGDPIVIGGWYNEGRFLYFSTLFDPTTRMGYGRYPFYLDVLQVHFNLWPLVRREQAEIYFEPGSREDVSIEDLVKMWKKNGFRTIYTAGWHVYRQWSYDYERLIRLAHENAIRVYLWLEFPHVNERIWDDHPEWREKTATGSDAIIDWRQHMALTDAACRQAVFAEAADMIQQYDWDGINLAGLYFESPLGPERPDLLTPFHPSAREAFQTAHGFDPIQLFVPSSSHFWEKNPTDWTTFQDFRKDQVIQLHREFLAFIRQEIQKKNEDFEIVVTSPDNIVAKKTDEYTTTDTKRLIDLQKEFDFTLQIDDPEEMWHLGPFRYDSLSSTYQRLMPGEPPILDINVISHRLLEASPAPTQQPTGIELYHSITGALQQKNRVAIYSESSIYEVDFPWIARALGRHSKERLSADHWQIQTDRTVMVDLDPKTHRNISVDGRIWPAYYRGKMILPSGSHTIRPLKRIENLAGTFKTSARLVDISGELESCEMFSRGLEMDYHSPVSNYIIVNEHPHKVILDGKRYETDIVHGIPGYTIRLPAGSHTVKVFTSMSGLVSLKNVSIVTSVTIVVVSGFAGSLLVILYIHRFRRRRHMNNHQH